jgi:rhodanese-related sulfurtransferase
VHCAGRTRSIIGAATLKRMGAGKVYALKNGTSGWRLSGRELEIGSTRTEMPSLSAAGREKAEYEARRVAVEDGVHFVSVGELQSIRDRATHENVYLIDVRSREEYRDGHLPGFRWVPGGQLVQATDSYIAVRDCTIVLSCDGVARAAMTASWLAQMGYPRVLVLDGGTTAWQAAGQALEAGMTAHQPAGNEAAKQGVSLLPPAALQLAMTTTAAPPTVIFAGSSDEYSAGHIPGSHWLSRSYLELRIGEIAAPGESLVLTSPDETAAVLAAAALAKLGYRVSALAGGIDGWRETGLPVETGLAGVTMAPDDTLPFMRSFADMMNYLRWEEELGHKYERLKAEQTR